MSYVVLQQVSNKYAKSNAGKTLDKPVALRHIQQYFEPKRYTELLERYPEGYVYIWGAKLERQHQIPKMTPGQSLVLFRRGQKVFRMGIINDLEVNLGLASKLWGEDQDNQTWGIVYFLRQMREISVDVEDINKAIGRDPSHNWQGLTSIDGQKAKAAISIIRKHLDTLGE